MNSKLPLVLTSIILCLYQCAPSHESKTKIPNHFLHDEEVYDTPIKTQITTELIIEEDSINEVMIRSLLNEYYSLNMARTGFKHHTSPTSTYIYVYTSKAKAKAGMGQWIGMISKSHVDTKPSINISETQMKSLNEVKSERWGISYELRLSIWNEIIRAEDRAQQEADKKYPTNKPGITLKDLNKNVEFSDKRREQLENESARKHGVDPAILDSISIEGLVNGWPFPEYE